MATIPPGGQVPVEPPKLPPATPAERDALRKMIADNQWNLWDYDGRTSTGSVVRVSGIDEGMLNATLAAVPLAWPMPGVFIAGQKPALPANCVRVYFRPE